MECNDGTASPISEIIIDNSCGHDRGYSPDYVPATDPALSISQTVHQAPVLPDYTSANSSRNATDVCSTTEFQTPTSVMHGMQIYHVTTPDEPPPAYSPPSGGYWSIPIEFDLDCSWSEDPYLSQHPRPAVNRTEFGYDWPHRLSTTPATRPPDYLVISVVNCLFCCLLLGLVALCQSMRVWLANRNGHLEQAKHSSDAARRWNTAAVVVGVVVWILVIAFLISFAVW